MNYINIGDKIEIAMNIIFSSRVLVGTIIFILITLFLFVNKSISKKNMISKILFINVLAFIITAFLYNEYLGNTINEIINKIFFNIYFPSIEMYLFVLIFMFVIFLITICNFRMSKTYKNVNIIAFFSSFYLFLMILYVIATNNIDIFNASSIYTNKEVVSLLELSMLVFILWIVSITIIWISNSLYNYILKIRTTKVNDNVALSVNELREEAFSEMKEDVIYAYDEIENISPVTVAVDSETINPVTISNLKETPKYSLKDYKTFNNILKQIILLNSYKPRISLNDLLNENILMAFSEEDRELYKNMMNYCIK